MVLKDIAQCPKERAPDLSLVFDVPMREMTTQGLASEAFCFVPEDHGCVNPFSVFTIPYQPRSCCGRKWSLGILVRLGGSLEHTWCVNRSVLVERV